MKRTIVVAALTFGSSLSLAAVARPEAIRSVVKGHRGEIRGCYMRAVAKNPNLEGELIIDWTVNDKGSVEEAQVNEGKSTLSDANIEACVVGKLRSWKFPSAPKGQVVKVSYPLMFTN